MNMKRIVPRQKLEIDVRPNDSVSEVRLLDSLVQAKHESPTYTLQIRVDTLPVLTFPNIRTFEIENVHLYEEINKRLTLLEEILLAVDTYGIAAIYREGPGEYKIHDPGSITFITNDPDDR